MLRHEAHDVVLGRLAKEVGVGDDDGNRQSRMKVLDVHLRTEPLERSDAGEVAARKFKTPKRRLDKPTMSRAKMIASLIEDCGMVCQGCGFEFPRKEFIELDHSAPRSGGGPNDISNRVLLCGPCNRLKRDDLTLPALRKLNRKEGFMIDESALANWR